MKKLKPLLLEKDHQRECNALLKKLGIRYYHDVSGTGKNRAQGQTAKPDLLFFANGVYAFEVKMTGKKPREDQYKELDLLKANGVKVGWGDFQTFVDFLIDHRILTP